MRILNQSTFAIWILFQGLATNTIAYAEKNGTVVVYFGYITQIHCKGRLFLSSVGDQKVITREALPKELGCGVLIQPQDEVGRTDLLIKTSAGDSHRILEIRKADFQVQPTQLEVWLDPDSISLEPSKKGAGS